MELGNAVGFIKDIFIKNVVMLNDVDALSSAQICSQLTNRLDRQQAAHREELDSLEVRIVLFQWSSAVMLPISPSTSVML